jgi:predicted phage terminase large subunit-like protein
MQTVTQAQLAITGALSFHRRRIAATSARAFAQVYLGKHLRLKPSRMHEDLFATLNRVTGQRGQRVAVAAPRGHAKSTVVSLAYVLWAILYGHEQFVLVISATKEQAVLLLKNIKDEIQGNELLLEDFPDVCQQPGTGRMLKPWRENSILLRNGVMIRVLGSGQALRGVRHGPHRPSLIVCDDLENQEHCESAEQRIKLRDWFEKTLLKAGDTRTNVVVVGTVLHYDSLLANLTHPKLERGKAVGWENRLYRAVEVYSERMDLWDRWEAIRVGEKEHQGETGPNAAATFYEANKIIMLKGAKVLWPEQEDYLRLMQIRSDEGRLSFQSEKQNEPLDPERCLFREDSFHYWDNGFSEPMEMVRRIGQHCRIYGACDPSLGKNPNRGDYSAIITVAKNLNDNSLYVLHADIARRKPEETNERIVQLAKVFKYRDFVVEGNQFQTVMVEHLRQQAQAAGVSLHPRSMNSTANKQARIEGLEPYISSGRLKFSRCQTMLLEQLRQFPLGAHDDGPDALEMCISWCAERRVATGGRVVGMR